MGLRPAARRLLLGLGALVFSLLLLELGARLASRSGLLPRADELAARLEGVLAATAGPTDAAGQLTNNLVVHPFLGFAVDPDLARADGFPNGPVSELGFVGADPLNPTPPGTARVAVLGGSFASQLCNRTREPLVLALANLPEIGARPILLDCLAIGSARQPQQLMTLAWVASLGTRYDVVLNIDGFNDIVLALTYNHRKGIFRGYPQAWDQRVGGLPDRTTQIAIGRVALLDDQRQQWARRADRLARLSTAALLGWNVVDRRLARRRGDLAIAIDDPDPRERWQRRADTWAVTGPRLAAATPEQAQALAAADWRHASESLDALVRGLGGTYIHALQPNQYAADAQPLLPDAERALRIDPNHFYAPAATSGYPLLIDQGKVLAEHGVRFIDLTDVFRDSAEPVWSDACCHLTDRGYELVIAALARRW